MAKKDVEIISFIEIYVDSALELSRKNLTLDEFEYRLRDNVCAKTGIPHDAVKYLHHPFHWTFFHENNSPFRDLPCNSDWRSPRVGLKREQNIYDRFNLIYHVFGEYERYLSGRTVPLIASGINISR